MTPLHDLYFPNESAEYRAARNALLDAEMALRRNIESVAAQRRRLPPGGIIKEDYVFEEVGRDGADVPAGQRVQFSELFRDGMDSLLVYSFMFGPRMKAACPSCTSILDGLDGESPHVAQQSNFVVVAKSPPERLREFARGRGWRHLRLLSSAGNSYNTDYLGEDKDGSQMPMMNVFTRRGGEIRHSYGTELLYARREPGQDGRHVDMVWPLWNMLDLTPEGRGTDWNPKLNY